MDEQTKLGLGVLGAAMGLGPLGDWLLRATPWGINVLLWVAALAGAAVALTRWGGWRWLEVDAGSCRSPSSSPLPSRGATRLSWLR
jgi:hypothetical protein